mmetsp:Transcript_35706/g.111433  ORF Transcript_35706/g.111433 Transcript_35706/m.111433 type:complete len:453 (-) Transcript_35706:31-1389(-)
MGARARAPKGSALPADPLDERLTPEGAVTDASGKLAAEAYTGFKEHFAAEPPRARHPNPAFPGLRADEAAEGAPVGLRSWSDDRGAGWMVKHRRGQRYFSSSRWGSWRLAFLLARLQRAVWEHEAPQEQTQQPVQTEHPQPPQQPQEQQQQQQQQPPPKRVRGRPGKVSVALLAKPAAAAEAHVASGAAVVGAVPASVVALAAADAVHGRSSGVEGEAGAGRASTGTAGAAPDEPEAASASHTGGAFGRPKQQARKRRIRSKSSPGSSGLSSPPAAAGAPLAPKPRRRLTILWGQFRPPNHTAPAAPPRKRRRTRKQQGNLIVIEPKSLAAPAAGTAAAGGAEPVADPDDVRLRVGAAVCDGRALLVCREPVELIDGHGPFAGGLATSAASVPACVICRQPPIRPRVAVLCGHYGCGECWDGWLAKDKSKCPVCRKAVRTNNLLTLRGWGDP